MSSQIREKNERKAAIIGIILTVALHLCGLVLIKFNGLKYIYPPPKESALLLDFSEQVQQPIAVRGSTPRSETPDKTKPVELVQKSQSPHSVSKENLTPETKPDNFGDIETPAPEPKEEPKLDPRAAFPGMAKKDTSLSSPHSAETPSANFKAGQSDGNSTSGRTDVKPNAHLQGRSLDKGGLRKPAYNVQEEGTVVVEIWVDQYGTVQRASAGADGTTVSSQSLWAAARKAAMETKFTMSADAPALQRGTITYIFNLK